MNASSNQHWYVIWGHEAVSIIVIGIEGYSYHNNCNPFFNYIVNNNKNNNNIYSYVKYYAPIMTTSKRLQLSEVRYLCINKQTSLT